MAISEAKRKANQRWDAANMETLSCKVKREQAKQFRAYCEIKGETVNAALQGFVSVCTGSEETPQDAPQCTVSDFTAMSASEGRRAGKSAYRAYRRDYRGFHAPSHRRHDQAGHGSFAYGHESGAGTGINRLDISEAGGYNQNIKGRCDKRLALWV